MMKRAATAALFAGVLMSSCSIPPDTTRIVRENPTVAAARTELVGLSESEIRMCAGFPADTAPLPDGTIWAYKRDFPRGNLNLAAPITLFGTIPAVNSSANVPSGGYCSTQFRMKDGRVTEVEFAGDNNTSGEINGLCVSTVDGCVAYARRHAGK